MPARKQIQYVIDERGCFVCFSHRKSDKGYPRITRSGKAIYVSRYIWELKNGKIPENLYVLHRCDNPACINVEHLFLGTNNDNIRDKVNKKRHCFGEKNGRAKLTDSKVKEIISLINSGLCSQRYVARIFGVNQALIYRIIHKKAWKHVTQQPPL